MEDDPKLKDLTPLVETKCPNVATNKVKLTNSPKGVWVNTGVKWPRPLRVFALIVVLCVLVCAIVSVVKMLR